MSIPPIYFSHEVISSRVDKWIGERILQLSKLAEQVYVVEQNVTWLALVYLALIIFLPTGIHTDFSVLCTRLDVLLSFLPVGLD